MSEHELYEQLELLQKDLTEIKTRLLQGWKRNRWRHELLHLENLLVLSLVLNDRDREENLRLIEDSAASIMRHFAGLEGGEVIAGEAASLLGLIDTLRMTMEPEGDTGRSRSEGS